MLEVTWCHKRPHLTNRKFMQRTSRQLFKSDYSVKKPKQTNHQKTTLKKLRYLYHRCLYCGGKAGLQLSSQGKVCGWAWTHYIQSKQEVCSGGMGCSAGAWITVELLWVFVLAGCMWAEMAGGLGLFIRGLKTSGCWKKKDKSLILKYHHTCTW